MQYNKGQIGQTATWIVATIIIIVIVFIFVYAAGFIAKGKVLSGLSFGGSDKGEYDLATQQTMFAMMDYRIVAGRFIDQLIEKKPFRYSSIGTLMTNADIKCDFYVYDGNSKIIEYSNINRSNIRSNEILLDLGNDREVRLKC